MCEYADLSKRHVHVEMDIPIFVDMSFYMDWVALIWT